MNHPNDFPSSHSFLITFSLLLLVSHLFAAKWLQKESEHFVVIYKPAHAYLVPHILTAAEASLERLEPIFDYQPSEKIYINTYDFSDYGSAGTTTVPENYIRLQIEPIELGYESMPFQERFQWLISHELVHIVVNDKATRAEKIFRSLFSKVPPQNIQPLSIFYSLLTNRTRYSPRWHQEGIAVFMETWLNGGFGRVLGNFDEMYFRSLVYEQQSIPSEKILDAKVSYESFLVETLFYLYGARFDAYLASQYGYQKLIDWYSAAPGEFYQGFGKKFKKIFGISFEEGWQGFIKNEVAFQQKNIQRLKKSSLTRIDPIPDTPSGWVTPAYPEPGEHAMVFGYHQSHHLTAIARVNLHTGSIEHLGSLPSPSILQIASTAYDNNLKLLFYTANNNKLFRDIYVLSTVSKKNKLLFPDCRVGQITVSPTTHELWGIQHYVGKSTLVYSAYPYRELIPVVGFEVGDNLQQLSVSPSGRYLAAILHQASGRQALIVADLQRIRDGKNFSFSVISEEGSPGNPSWSPDETFIYWNAYINGVSNIYRYDNNTGEILPFSNVIRGLFKPVYINADSLFAFEFTSRGFRPVIIPNQPAERLSAIEYFGQQVVDKNAEVTKWALPAPQPIQSTKDTLTGVVPFQPLKHLQIQSFIPVVTGFQSQIAVGVYTQISDPLLSNFFTVEAAATPKRENFLQPRFHLKVKYEYMRKYIFSISHNAPNFYDLLNDRKQGMIGNKFTAGYRKFFKYDIPHKIEWNSEAALYTGIEAINDNLVKVTRPDLSFCKVRLNPTIPAVPLAALITNRAASGK